MADRPDPYETLGVAKEASPEEIRRAWQRAASEAHPDRQGGSNERMAAVNAAYQLLKDPTARARWDQGAGSDAPMTDEQKAMQLLCGAAARAISEAINGGDPLAAIRKALDGQVGGCQHARIQARKELESLGRLRRRLRGPERNFLQLAIDREITQRELVLENCDHDEPLFELALSMLEGYRLEPEGGYLLGTHLYDSQGTRFTW